MRIIQPPMWCGVQKGGPLSPMVCGACPDWQECSEADRCRRASDDDYRRGRPFSAPSEGSQAREGGDVG